MCSGAQREELATAELTVKAKIEQLTMGLGSDMMDGVNAFLENRGLPSFKCTVI